MSFWDNLFWSEFKIYYWFKNKYWDWKLKRKTLLYINENIIRKWL